MTIFFHFEKLLIHNTELYSTDDAVPDLLFSQV